MGTFVTNPSEMIPGPKNATRVVPEGGNPADYMVAGDYNSLRGACHDLRDAVLNGSAPFIATGATTARTPAARASDVVNVRDFGAVGDGVTDDTAAIQAAIDVGGPVYMPPGIYKVSGTLNLTAAANNGQVIRGAGALSDGGVGTSKTVIRPTAAVTKLFLIDGSGLPQVYLQYWGFEDFSVDMTNMTDAATTAVFDQRRSWGGTYRRISILNEGTDKRGWLLGAGAMVTLFDTTRARIYEATGASDGDQVTTITFLNAQAYTYLLNYASAINITGGALQGGWAPVPAFGNSRIKMFHVTGLMANGTDVEGSGIYLDIGASCSAIFSTGNQLVGFSGTVYSALPSRPYTITDQAGLPGSFSMTAGEFQFSNGGADSTSKILSGAANKWASFQMGRTSGEVSFSVAANTNDFVSGTAAGDGVIGGTGSQFIQSGGAAVAKASPGVWKTLAVSAGTRTTLTYGASVAVDASAGSIFEVSPTDLNAFTIAAPTNGVDGATITITIRNSAGGALGAITWPADYRLAGAWVSPAHGYRRSITFTSVGGTAWFEVSRTAADVPL